MTRTLLLWTSLALFGLLGCVGHPDVDGTRAPLLDPQLDVGVELDDEHIAASHLVVPEWQWRVAEPCGEILPVGSVRRTSGEAGLGALVGANGQVLCVDALFRFDEALEGPWHAIGRVHGEEPNPEPM